MSFRRKAGLIAAAVVGAALLILIPTAAFAAPGATKKIIVTRDASDPSKIDITWEGVSGAERYNVSVFDGTKDEVRIVPATGSPRVTITRAEPCVRLRVNIGSRNAAGAGATSHNVWLNSLAPGGVSGLKTERSGDGSKVIATWKPPTWLGYGKPGGYRVQLTQTTTDKSVVFNEVVSDPTATLTGFDAKKDYWLSVVPENGFGSCGTAKAAVGSPQPGAVGNLKVTRDGNAPTKVNVSWIAPAYGGWGPVTHYQICHGLGKADKCARIDGTSTQLTLDEVAAWVIQVQAANQFGLGRISGPITVPSPGAIASTPSVKPGISVGKTEDQIHVKLTNRIGDFREYPRLVVRLKPVADGPFADEQWGANGAQLLTFLGVPRGLYVLTVSGANDKDEEEWVRQIVNMGDAGKVATATWQVLHGKPTVTAESVSTSRGTEVRLVTTAARTSGNMALSSTVTLREGRGYGLVVRASGEGTKLSGYLVEYDGSARTMYLRSQVSGNVCGTALASSKLTTAAAAAGAHRLMVVAKGESLVATIDDAVVLNVPSLAAAVIAAKCEKLPAGGVQAGLQTWQGSGGASVLFSGTALN